MHGSTVTTVLTITETCSGGRCEQVTTESVTLTFTANDTWAALDIASREAGVEVGVLMDTLLRAGLSLAGYQLDEVAA